MKKNSNKVVKLIAALALTSILFLAGYGQEQEKIIETVMVSNVEVPVRVFDGNKPVDGLTKEDFRIFVNGKQKSINGFYQVRKKLETTVETPGKESARTPGRLFVLLFNLYDYHQNLDAVMDTFFKNVLRPDDRLTVITNNFFYPEWEVTDPVKTRQEINEILKKEVKRMRTSLLDFQTQLNAITKEAKFRLAHETALEDYPVFIYREFFQSHRLLMNQMKSRYLAMPTAEYIKVARYLQGQEREKYVLNFFQVGRLPLLSPTGELMLTLDEFIAEDDGIARNLKPLFMDYLFEQRPQLDLISEDVAKIFLNSGATFHTMLLKPLNVNLDNEYRYQPIATDTEIMLKKLSHTTGGTIINTNKMSNFVKKVAAKEDIVYMLTYNPGGSKKNSKLTVKLNVSPDTGLTNKNYRLSYDDQKRLKVFQNIAKKIDKANSLEIGGIQCTQSRMFLKLTNMKVVRRDGKDFGAVQIRVKIKKRNRVVNYFTTTFKGAKKKGVAPVALPNLPQGNYTIVVEVKDLFAFNGKFIGDAVNFVKQSADNGIQQSPRNAWNP